MDRTKYYYVTFQMKATKQKTFPEYFDTKEYSSASVQFSGEVQVWKYSSVKCTVVLLVLLNISGQF